MRKNGYLKSGITALAIAWAGSSWLAAPAASAEAVASGECNGNSSVELTDLKRSSGVLTAKMVYTAGSDDAKAYVYPEDTYVLDAAGGKKYEVLKDSDGKWLASSNTSHSLYKAGDTHRAWYKFLAPPADVKAISITLKECEPLEDVPITDK
jgi:hypothetical protein